MGPNNHQTFLAKFECLSFINFPFTFATFLLFLAHSVKNRAIIRNARLLIGLFIMSLVNCCGILYALLTTFLQRHPQSWAEWYTREFMFEASYFDTLPSLLFTW